MEARRVKVKIIYGGVNIAQNLISLVYTDNTGVTDDVTMTLDDRKNAWKEDIEICETIKISVELINWNKEGDNRVFDIGVFEIDSITYSETVQITAVAVPLSSSVRSQRKNRAWEKVKLSKIIKDIAKENKLGVIFDSDDDVKYDRQEQKNISDLQFIDNITKENGMILKVTDKNIVAISEEKYDKAEALCVIKKGDSNIIGYPTFTINAKNIYKACLIKQFDEKTKKVRQGYFGDRSVKTGHTLFVDEQYNDTNKTIDLNKKAQNLLREQNKQEKTCSITMVGDFKYYAGTNINIVGYGKLDGKYHAETVTHNITNNGYTTDIDLRLCLNY